jgi:hypothetical protein
MENIRIPLSIPSWFALCFFIVGVVILPFVIFPGGTGLILSLSPLILGVFALKHLMNAPGTENWRRSKAVFADEKPDVEHVASICDSFVKGGAESASRALLSLTGDSKTNAILALPRLLDTVLSQGEVSRSDLESLEKFMETARIKPLEIPYPQEERMLKSLILSKIPDAQKENIAGSPLLSEFTYEKRRVGEKKAEKTGIGIGRWIWTFACWAISIFSFFAGIVGFLFCYHYGADTRIAYVIPFPCFMILWGVIFYMLGRPKTAKSVDLPDKPEYPGKIEAINAGFIQNGAEGACRKILSFVGHDEAKAKESSIRALPLIADTLLGKDALTPEDRASFKRFIEISGVDSSQIPDELKERIVQSFLRSKIPYEQKEGILRPILLGA